VSGREDYNPRLAKPVDRSLCYARCVGPEAVRFVEILGGAGKRSGSGAVNPPFTPVGAPCDTDGSNKAKPAENCFCYT
jgi:hypothetical protein